MKKLTIKKAAKQLDFSTEYQFVEYVNETFINGNFSSLKRLFLELDKTGRKLVLLNCDKEVSDYLIINAL